ncbi:MAG: biotin/lipoyl-containing protein, partial [bacterium]
MSPPTNPADHANPVRHADSPVSPDSPGSSESSVFSLPDLGEGLTEAEIIAWRVAEGETVNVDDVVVDVETAKAAVE